MATVITVVVAGVTMATEDDVAVVNCVDVLLSLPSGLQGLSSLNLKLVLQQKLL